MKKRELLDRIEILEDRLQEQEHRLFLLEQRPTQVPWPVVGWPTNPYVSPQVWCSSVGKPTA